MKKLILILLVITPIFEAHSAQETVCPNRHYIAVNKPDVHISTTAASDKINSISTSIRTCYHDENNDNSCYMSIPYDTPINETNGTFEYIDFCSMEI